MALANDGIDVVTGVVLLTLVIGSGDFDRCQTSIRGLSAAA